LSGQPAFQKDAPTDDALADAAFRFNVGNWLVEMAESNLVAGMKWRQGI
jgi:hypothetical protein